MPLPPKSTGPYDLSKFTPLEDVLTTELPPITWDVQDLIARNERIMMFGEFASLKSWLLMSLTIAFATGTPWLGKFPVTPRSVVYFDEENSKRTAQRRFQRLHQGIGSPQIIRKVHVASRIGVQISRQAQDRMIQTFQGLTYTPEVIILETLRRVMPGGESNQEDVSAFWGFLTDIIGTDITVIIAHHMRKPGALTDSPEDNRYRASGSTDILAGADACYAVERLQKGSVKIECVKAREVEEPPPFGVKLDAPDVGGPARLSICPTNQHPNVQLVFDTLQKQPNGEATFDVLRLLLKPHQFSVPSLYRYLSTLKDAGMVANSAHGVWTCLIQAHPMGATLPGPSGPSAPPDAPPGAPVATLPLPKPQSP